MTTERNKAIAARYFTEVLSQGKLATMEEIFDTDVIAHFPGGEVVHGLDALKQLVAGSRDGVPDMQFTVEDQIAEANRVALRLSARGTHRGDFFGLAATNKEISWTGNSIFRLADGRIEEFWAGLDMVNVMRQAGAIRE